MLDAYHGESNVAFYPRIVVSAPVYEKCGAALPDLIELLIAKDRDGMYFVDVLSRFGFPEDDAHYKEYLSNVRSALLSNFESVKHDPRKATKVIWFISYFNDKIKFLPEFENMKVRI